MYGIKKALAAGPLKACFYSLFGFVEKETIETSAAKAGRL
jgi:hypothetical protein